MQSNVLKASPDKPAVLDSWRAEVLQLEAREILQICYGLEPFEERLWLYLNELRRRSSPQAQLASCILSYDLARRNNERARREFAYLAATMRELARDKVLVDNLLGDDSYLRELWGLVRSHLLHWDPRLPAESLEPVPVKVGFLPLLSDADFFDEGLQENFDKSQKDGNYRLQLALNTFLGCDPTIPYVDPNSGFKMATSADIERVEAFLKEIASLEKNSPQARGFKVLVLFFYGTHLRSQDIFGGINERKEVLLKDALQSFSRYGEEFWSIVGTLEPLHEKPGVWDKIVDLILDYCDWLALNSPKKNLDDYDVVQRLMERQSIEQGRRNSLRS